MEPRQYALVSRYTPYAIPAFEPYRRRSSSVRLLSHPYDMPATIPMPSKSEATTDDPGLTWIEFFMIAALTIFVTPVALGICNYLLLEYPLRLFFQHQAPYSALTQVAHMQLTMWGSLIITIITASSTALLWFAYGMRLWKSRTLRWLLLVAYVVLPLAVGVAARPSDAPGGFRVEHALRLGLWGLVPERTLLLRLSGALLESLPCLSWSCAGML